MQPILLINDSNNLKIWMFITMRMGKNSTCIMWMASKRDNSTLHMFLIFYSKMNKNILKLFPAGEIWFSFLGNHTFIKVSE